MYVIVENSSRKHERMDSLVFLKTAVILFAPSLHFVANCKEHLVVHPVNALNVAIHGVAIFTLWELQHPAS